MREEKRELYREGTPDNLKKGYTDLIYGGSGVEVDKGVINASGGSGGSGGGGGVNIIELTYDDTQNMLFFDGSLLNFESINILHDTTEVENNYYFVTAITALNVIAITSFESSSEIRRYTYMNDGSGRYTYEID